MNLDDYGYFDGERFIFSQPFPFLHKDGVVLLTELNYATFTKHGVDIEALVASVLKKQLGIPDPLRQRKPGQEAQNQDPGE